MRLLVVTLSAGQGHISVAVAIADAARHLGARVQVVDMAEADPRGLYGIAPVAFKALSGRFMSTYDALWRMAERDAIHEVTARAYAKHAATALVDVLRVSAPTHILTVAPLYLPATVSRAVALTGSRAHTTVFVTDLCTAHRSWVAGPETFVFAPSREVAQRLQRFGGARIEIVEGVPIRRRFFCARQSRSRARRSYGLDPHNFTILVWGGGLGSGGISKTLRHMLQVYGSEVQFVLLTGSNASLVRRFTRERTVHVHPLGADIVTLLDAADVVLGKPGSSAVMEAAARKRWSIYSGPVGAQEIGNAAYGAQRGWGVATQTRSDICDEITAALTRWQLGDDSFGGGAAPAPDTAHEVVARLREETDERRRRLL